MKIDTEVAVNAAANQLSRFIERVDRDTIEIVREANLSKTIGYFYELREAVKSLQKQTAELQNHLNSLSHNLIPKMFLNANVKTLMVPGVGNAGITAAWSAKVLNKKLAFEWLRATGNDGLIIETINSSTLGAFAKNRMLAGEPSLPNEIFQVGSTPFVTIKTSGVISEEDFAATVNPDA